jgi:hypothetical protein
MIDIRSSALFAAIDSCVRRENGVEYFEHHVGDFAAVVTPMVIDLRFSEVDALALARMITHITGGVDRAIVTLYPYLDQPWQELASDGWTTLYRHVFRRRGILGLGASYPWVAGYAHSESKLAQVLYWAWTLPGRDTLTVVHAAPEQTRPLVEYFEDDREDTDVNDTRLIPFYPTIVSRAFSGRYVRVASTALDTATIQQLQDAIRSV